MSLPPPTTLADYRAFKASLARAAKPRPAGPDSAGSGAAEAGAAGSAGRGRRLVRWLRRLDAIGVDLIVSLKAVMRRPGGENAVDTGLAWALLKRAYRWAQALRTRLAAEAPDDDLEPLDREQLFDRPDLSFGAPRPKLEPVPYDCIAGRTDAEVVAQVCADLTAAATLLGESAAAREIARIAAAAHALLGGPAPETVNALPIERAWDPAELTATKAKLQAARTQPPAPDSG